MNRAFRVFVCVVALIAGFDILAWVGDRFWESNGTDITIEAVDTARCQANTEDLLEKVAKSVGEFMIRSKYIPRTLADVIQEGDRIVDGWGRKLSMVRSPLGIIVCSAGIDGEFGSDDDLVRMARIDSKGHCIVCEKRENEGAGNGLKWILAIFVALVAIFMLVVLPVCFFRRLRRKMLANPKCGLILRLIGYLNKKPVWIGLLAIIVVCLGLAYIKENRKPFAMDCLEEVLCETNWSKAGSSDRDEVLPGTFMGVQLGELVDFCSRDILQVPVPLGGLLDDCTMSEHGKCYKTYVNGKVVSISLCQEFIKPVAEAIHEGDSLLSDLVKKSIREVLVSTCKSYLSSGEWFWNGHRFVIGAGNATEARDRSCAYVSISTFDEHGVHKAYMDIEVSRGDPLLLSMLPMAKKYTQESSRDFLMYKASKESGGMIDPVPTMKLPGLFGVKLGETIKLEGHDVAKEGALFARIPVSGDAFGIKTCSVCALPLSSRAFMVGANLHFSEIRDCVDFCSRVTRQFQSEYNRCYLFDELDGSSMVDETNPDFMILQRWSMKFADDRMLFVELGFGAGRACALIEAIDFSLQRQLPDELDKAIVILSQGQ